MQSHRSAPHGWAQANVRVAGFASMRRWKSARCPGGGSTASAGSVCSRRRWREAHAISLAFHRKLENGYTGMGRGVSFEIEDIVAEVRGMVARCRQCIDVLCILWWQLKEVTGRSEIVQ